MADVKHNANKNRDRKKADLRKCKMTECRGIMRGDGEQGKTGDNNTLRGRNLEDTMINDMRLKGTEGINQN